MDYKNLKGKIKTVSLLKESYYRTEIESLEMKFNKSFKKFKSYASKQTEENMPSFSDGIFKKLNILNALGKDLINENQKTIIKNYFLKNIEKKKNLIQSIKHKSEEEKTESKKLKEEIDTSSKEIKINFNSDSINKLNNKLLNMKKKVLDIEKRNECKNLEWVRLIEKGKAIKEEKNPLETKKKLLSESNLNLIKEINDLKKKLKKLSKMEKEIESVNEIAANEIKKIQRNLIEMDNQEKTINFDIENTVPVNRNEANKSSLEREEKCIINLEEILKQTKKQTQKIEEKKLIFEKEISYERKRKKDLEILTENLEEIKKAQEKKCEKERKEIEKIRSDITKENSDTFKLNNEFSEIQKNSIEIEYKLTEIGSKDLIKPGNMLSNKIVKKEKEKNQNKRVSVEKRIKKKPGRPRKNAFDRKNVVNKDINKLFKEKSKIGVFGRRKTPKQTLKNINDSLRKSQMLSKKKETKKSVFDFE